MELKTAVLGHTALSNIPQYHAQTAIITPLTRILSDGAEPLNSLQGGSASGSMPRMSRPTATGGNPRLLPKQGRRSRGRTTCYTKPARTTNQHQPVKVMHWNAEGVHNKQTDLQHVLNENNITICCIQETHLQPKNPLKSEDTSAFDPTELAGATEGFSPCSETTSMLFRPQHTWMTPSFKF